MFRVPEAVICKNPSPSPPPDIRELFYRE